MVELYHIQYFLKFTFQSSFSWPNRIAFNMCFKNFFYLEVIWRENSALGKPTNGSSVYGNDYTNWSPDYATDGIVQKNDTEFFHSAFEQFPWIRIDLLEIAPISFIRVYNRKSLGMLFIICPNITLFDISNYWYCVLKIQSGILNPLKEYS